MNQVLKKIQCMNGSTLKIIAMVVMLIDHIGAFFLSFLIKSLYGETDTGNLQFLYLVLRQIGRTAFPIFCFLLVEGFLHTKNSFRYMVRLLLFAFISEIPFDLAFADSIFYIKAQNVYFTLAIGMAMMIVVHKLITKGQSLELSEGSGMMTKELYNVLAILLFLAFCGLGELINCDYGGNGVALIGIFYFLRNNRILACILGYMSFLWEAFCFPAFLLIPLYNGKRGIRIKYLFYAFYPLHIIVLYFLRVMIC